ncbi:E3 ubiquitin-protein ligase LRSAM1 isoform X2 [Anabrus simplex]|uniref:E3 ubiquitin-protein ligase LRSAM1 isoform X2 n=1 Tax=Anabrus simplex TaxID=316456 RepID=UPI0035A2B5F7
MPLFGKKESKDAQYRARLEHKLYLARENPEPVFDLAACGLKTVPAGIYSLCKVFRKEVLYLQENLLVSLAAGGKMQDLSLLQVLDLHSNNLAVLPDDIRYLKNLRELNVKANQLTFLPEVISELENLQTLIVSENKLEGLPSSIGCLLNLQHLDIRLNKDLSHLPTNLCKACALRELHLNPENFTYPSAAVLRQGTESIMKFLAAESGLNFEELQSARYELPGPSSSSSQDQEQENKLKAITLQLERLKLLEDLVQQQTKLECEILQIQRAKEADRRQLLQELQQEETATDLVVSQLLSLNSNERNSVHLQLLFEREREEEEHILNVRQEEYRNLRRRDILNAMETLLEEECQRERKLREYEEGRWRSTRTLLDQEMESNKQLEERLVNYGLANTELVNHLQKDEELQRAAVATLLERNDARSWGLLQQVKLVEAQLAALSALEMKRRSLRITEHVEDLCEKRIALSELLMDLLTQQDVRRKQLLATVKEMERRRWMKEGEEVEGDYWLLQYQLLLDSHSGSLMELERSLDPALVHQLIISGVIHCMPLLAEWMTSPSMLTELTDDALIKAGISSPETRRAILKAVENYHKDITRRDSSLSQNTPTPTAPIETDVERVSRIQESECVICMDLVCEVIFVPCGHMCCCIKCSELMGDCPMCRSHVDQKIRVILP